ncbi:MAG TPA: Nif3-like dinuclear metal center hexameric protein [Cyclobacteriaceae bacterium]|nr:Nif3-like dinuclear metal center hexameric protein [Cyclobacteriaceae bacterium]
MKRQGNQMNRRTFISALSATAAAGSLVASHAFGNYKRKDNQTIQDVIDMLIAIPGTGPYAKTVDTIKSGDATQSCRGVVTTFMANAEVIRKAIALGANLIVTHEPTYYNHEDNTEWLSKDGVYQYKRKLLEDNKVVVFRYHDYIHSIKPDPVVVGFAEKLSWEKYQDKDNPRICTIPSQSLSSLVREIKSKLKTDSIRFVGVPDMNCTKIGLLVGASGGTSHINMLSTTDIDVLIVGEIHEWETSEYVRDAITAGENKAVIIAGHAPTEEPGMEWLAKWLQPKLADTKVTHVPGTSPFMYM